MRSGAWSASPEIGEVPWVAILVTQLFTAAVYAQARRSPDT